MRKQVLLFDFDGTIADSFSVTKEIIITLADAFGYKVPDDAEFEIFRGKSAREVIRYLHIPLYSLPVMLNRGLSELKKNAHRIKPISGMPEVLQALKKQGYVMGILTSNTNEIVNAFLQNYNLEIFDYLFSEFSIFGKVKLLKKFFRETGCKPEEVVYIGDEVRDIEASRKSGIRVISVSWGYNTKNRLEKSSPDILVEKPDELIPAIRKLPGH